MPRSVKPRDPELIGTSEAGRILGVNRMQVYHYAKGGKLQVAEYTRGGRMLFRRSYIEAVRKAWEANAHASSAMPAVANIGRAADVRAGKA